MKKSLFFCSMLTILATNAFAAKPSVCPSVEAIKAGGIAEMLNANDEGQEPFWYGQTRNNYGTDRSWKFDLIFYDGNELSDPNEAKAKALVALNKLQVVIGPDANDSRAYDCAYYDELQVTNFLVGGIASTSNESPAMKLAKLYHH